MTLEQNDPEGETLYGAV